MVIVEAMRRLMRRVTKREDPTKPQPQTSLPYIIPLNAVRRQLELPIGSPDAPGDILAKIRDEHNLQHLKGWTAEELSETTRNLQSETVVRKLAVETTPFADYPQINKLFLPARRITKKLDLLTFHDVYFATNGDRYTIFRHGCVDPRSTAIPAWRLMEDLFAENVRELDEFYYCGDLFSPHNPAHFISDHLSRAQIYADLLEVPSTALAFSATEAELCRALGDVMAPDAVQIGAFELVRVKSLHILSNSLAGHNPGHPFFFLDKKLIRGAAQAARKIAKEQGGAKGGLLYLNRLKMPRRKLVNEPALVELIESYGGRSVEMSEYSGAEQLKLMFDADVIVAPHGGALAGLIAARKNTGVLEIFAPGRGTLAFAGIATARGLRYDHMIGTPVDPETLRTDPEAVVPNMPWEVDLQAVDQKIRQLIG